MSEAAGDDQTTWTEVCRHVGLSDNLFPVCRKKVPGFFERFEGVIEDDDPEDFDEQLLSKALPVPALPAPAPLAAPAEKGEDAPIPYKKLALYGAGAAVAYLLWMRTAKTTEVVQTKTLTQPGGSKSVSPR